MTATAELTMVQPKLVQPALLVDGGRMILRAIQRVFGVALTLAAVGIWIAPGSSWENDVMLFKLILSMIAVLAGLGLMLSSKSPESPELEIDPIRREVRLLRPMRDGSAVVLERCRFGDLARAEVEGATVRFFGADGSLMAESMLVDSKALARLIAGLRDEGKLA